MKYKSPRKFTKTRTAPPIPFENKSGTIELRCPFCQDHHILVPNKESPCGTHIEVTCIQEVYSAHTVKHEKLVCVKCFKGGGEMVRYRNSFVHTTDCNPEARLLQEVPDNNRVAEFVYKLPAWIKPHIEKLTGKADCVFEIDNEGKKTGVVLAYLFWKAAANGKQITT